MEIEKKKQTLRKKIRAQLDSLSNKAVQTRSRKIVGRLCSIPLYKKAQTFFCYVSKLKEVNTHPLIKKALRAGKKVYAPRHIGQSNRIVAQQILSFPKGMKKGKYGILEPVGKGKRVRSLKKIDLFVLPGLAFDRHGGRLGWGKGTFDRFLEKEPAAARCCALAFDCQIVPRLPREPHDQTISLIITEKRIIKI